MTDITTQTLGFLAQRVEIAADEQQQQINALEQVLLNRTALVDIQQNGRKVEFLFTRRGAIHKVECYADMSMNVAEIRKVLLDD